MKTILLTISFILLLIQITLPQSSEFIENKEYFNIAMDKIDIADDQGIQQNKDLQLNKYGDILLAYDDGTFENYIYLTGGTTDAGTYFNSSTPSRILELRIRGVGLLVGQTIIKIWQVTSGNIDPNPSYSKSITISANQWNLIDLRNENWEVNGDFLASIEISNSISIPLDINSTPSQHSYWKSGTWQPWQTVSQSSGLPDGEWGIRALVKYESVNELLVLNPNGFENIPGDSTYAIEWQKPDTLLPNYYNLKYSIDGGLTYPNLIVSNINGSDTTYNWTVPIINSNNSRIKIEAFDISNSLLDSDESDNNFIIDSDAPGSFDLISPENNIWTNSTPNFAWGYSSGADFFQLWIDGNLYIDNLPFYPRSVILQDSLSLSSGWHTWYVKALDNAGNTTQSNQTRAIRVDATMPTAFDILSPPDNEWVTTTRPQFEWQASSDPGGSGLQKYTLNIDSMIYHPNISPDSTSITLNNEIQQGNHQWWVDAIDNAGNSTASNQEWNLKVDSWGPGVKYINGLTTDFYSITGSDSTTQFVDLLYSRIDQEVNYWTYNNHPSGVPVNCGIIWTREITGKTDGVHNLRITHDDGVRLWINNELIFDYWENWSNGNHSNSVYLKQGEWYIFRLEYFNGPQTGSVKLYWTPPGEAEELIPGQYFRTITNDFYLKEPYSYQWVNPIDVTLAWDNTIDLGIGTEKYQLYIDNNLYADNLTDSTFIIPDTLGYGNHWWYVNSIDSLGNISQSVQTWAFRVDDIAPNSFNIIAPQPDSIVLSPVPDFSWEGATDQGSGLDHYKLIIDGLIDRDNIANYTTTTQPSVPLNEGRHTWAVLAVDDVGNITSTDTIGFWVEYSNPPAAFTLISPINDDTLHTDLPTFLWHSSSDIGSGIQKYKVFVGNTNIGQTQDTVFTATVPINNGPQSWYVTAYDGINLSTTSNTGNFYVNKDNIGPVTEISDPVEGQIINTSTYIISGNVFDNSGGSGVDSIFISTDGGINWNYVQNMKRTSGITEVITNFDENAVGKLLATWSYTWSGYPDSVHTIMARSKDNVGNWGNADIITVLVDRLAPTVSGCQVVPEIVSADSVSISISFEEHGSGLNINYPPNVTVIPFNGSALSATQISFDTSANQWNGYININSGLNSGVAQIEIEAAQDLAGNIMVSNTNYTMYIDQIPPESFNLVAPDYNSWISENQPQFVWHQSSDSHSGIKQYQLFINDSLIVSNITPADTTTIPSNSLVDGNYSWKVIALDSADNQSTSDVWDLNIDATGPITEIITPIDGDTLQLGQHMISGHANDGLGIGVDSVFLSTDSGVSWNLVVNDSLNFETWSYNWFVQAKGNYVLKARGLDQLDNLGMTDSIIVIIPNTSPVVTSQIPDQSFIEDADTLIIVYNLNDVFNDIDNDPLAFTANSPDSNMYVWINEDTSLFFKSESNYFGQGSIIVFANDGDGGIISDTFNVNIDPINDPPIVNEIGFPNPITFDENKTYKFYLADTSMVSDVDDSLHTLNWTGTSSNPAVQVSIDSAKDSCFINFAPTEADTLEGTILFTVSDIAGLSDSILVDFNVILTGIEEIEDIPRVFSLSQNYPNPFNPETTIKFGIPKPVSVKLEVYNMLGQRVAVLMDQKKPAGYYEVRFAKENLSSGIYIYRIQAGEFHQVRKMVLLK